MDGVGATFKMGDLIADSAFAAPLSYMILAPNEMKACADEQKATKICLETVKLDADLYRIGHTKARNRDPKHKSPPLFRIVQKRQFQRFFPCSSFFGFLGFLLIPYLPNEKVSP